jgi:aerobic-type carbon monoxide dehydrogenase small subunit (CoxS/CutS family)
MKRINLTINGKVQQAEVDPKMPLLWLLRDHLKLTGTKYGCGMAQCGACTVHVGGQPTRSCTTPVSRVMGKQITTIEGLSEGRFQPLLQVWIEEDVSQCGYCQPGQLMTAAALIEKNSNPTDADIDKAFARKLRRCGTANRIRAAVKLAAGEV